MDTMEIAVPIPEAAKILGKVLSAQVVSGYPHNQPGRLKFTDGMDRGGEGLRVLVSLPDLHEDAVRWLTLPLLDPYTGGPMGPDLRLRDGALSARDRALVFGFAPGSVRVGPDGFLGVYLGDGQETRRHWMIGPPTAENLAPLAAAYAAWGGKRGTVPAWVKRAGHRAEGAYEGAYADEKKKAKGWR
jgi:hypothetical protein